MPVYEYICSACNEQFEAQRKFSDPALTQCALCGKGPVEKMISRSSFALKGSGWYQSDYGTKSGGASGCSSSKPACVGCPSASND